MDQEVAWHVGARGCESPSSSGAGRCTVLVAMVPLAVSCPDKLLLMSCNHFLPARVPEDPVTHTKEN